MEVAVMAAVTEAAVMLASLAAPPFTLRPPA